MSKILFAVKAYFPNCDGVSNVTKYLAEGLTSYHDVYVITMLETSLSVSEVVNGVNVERIDISSKKSRQTYIKRICDINPDVFICVCTQTWCFDWLRDDINLIQGRKILYTHGFSGLYPYPSDLPRGLNRFAREVKYNYVWKKYYYDYAGLIKQFDVVTHLSISNRSLEYAEHIGIKNNVIIGNAAEDIFFDRPVCENGPRTDRIRFIYVASFEPGKNQKGLLRAFVEIESQDCSLIFAGAEANDYYKELCALQKQLDEAGKLKGKHIEYAVGLSREELSELMETCDISIITSLREAYSISLLESCAKGLPIISTNVGNAHLVPGVIVVNEMFELPHIMDELCKRPVMREEMGKLVRNYALSNGRIIDKVEQLQSVIESLLCASTGDAL